MENLILGIMILIGLYSLFAPKTKEECVSFLEEIYFYYYPKGVIYSVIFLAIMGLLFGLGNLFKIL